MGTPVGAHKGTAADCEECLICDGTGCVHLHLKESLDGTEKNLNGQCCKKEAGKVCHLGGCEKPKVKLTLKTSVHSLPTTASRSAHADRTSGYATPLRPQVVTFPPSRSREPSLQQDSRGLRTKYAVTRKTRCGLTTNSTTYVTYTGWRDDDSHNDDEDLSPQNDHIYSVDGPGLSGPNGNAFFDELVLYFNFTEWVMCTYCGIFERCSEDLKWHSKLTLKRNPQTNTYERSGPNGAGPGHVPMAPP